MERTIAEIFEKVYAEQPITKEDCVKLLSLEEKSEEAAVMRSLATGIVRERTDNTGAIFAQIGLECHPCGGIAAFVRLREISRKSLPQRWMIRRLPPLRGLSQKGTSCTVCG